MIKYRGYFCLVFNYSVKDGLAMSYSYFYYYLYRNFEDGFLDLYWFGGICFLIWVFEF